jgi:hypothetical protein
MGNRQSTTQYEKLKTYTPQNISYAFRKPLDIEWFMIRYKFSLNDIDYVFHICSDEHKYDYYCNAYKGKYDPVKLKLTTYPKLKISNLCKRGFAYEFYLDDTLILDTVVYLKDGCEVGYW